MWEFGRRKKWLDEDEDENEKEKENDNQKVDEE